MNDPWSTVHSDIQLHPDFMEGRRLFRQGNLPAALICFKTASQTTIEHHVHAGLYMSYLGLTQVPVSP